MISSRSILETRSNSSSVKIKEGFASPLKPITAVRREAMALSLVVMPRVIPNMDPHRGEVIVRDLTWTPRIVRGRSKV
jgi:hypothetical protein